MEVTRYQDSPTRKSAPYQHQDRRSLRRRRLLLRWQTTLDPLPFLDLLLAFLSALQVPKQNLRLALHLLHESDLLPPDRGLGRSWRSGWRGFVGLLGYTFFLGGFGRAEALRLRLGFLRRRFVLRLRTIAAVRVHICGVVVGVIAIALREKVVSHWFRVVHDNEE